MVNTSFRLKAANKAFFCCSVRLRKALIKYRGQNFFEYSFRSNIHVKISKYGVPLRALVPCKCYCECRIQTIFFPGRERQNLPSEMRCENPQRPSVVKIKRANQIGLRVWKNINQSTPEGQILTLSSA